MVAPQGDRAHSSAVPRGRPRFARHTRTGERTSGRRISRAKLFDHAGHEWAFDTLLEVGYRYDSSLFPINRSNYGYPATPPLPHLIHRRAGDLMEFPLTTTRFMGKHIPAAGGGYLRHFPYSIIRKAFSE